MKILLGMPNMGQIQMQTVTSLISTLGVVKGMTPLFIANSLIYTARDFICEYAIENGFDCVLFVDSDMVFGANDYERLMDTMQETGADIVSGTYVTRIGDPRIVAYDKVERRESRPFKSPAMKNVELYSTEDLQEVEAVGMGFCLVRVSLLKKMFKDYPSLFEPKWGFGEDIAFCQRAKRYTKVMLDRRVNLGHLGTQVNNVPQMVLKTKFAQKSSSGMGESEVTNGKD